MHRLQILVLVAGTLLAARETTAMFIFKKCCMGKNDIDAVMSQPKFRLPSGYKHGEGPLTKKKLRNLIINKTTLAAYADKSNYLTQKPDIWIVKEFPKYNHYKKSLEQLISLKEAKKEDDEELALLKRLHTKDISNNYVNGITPPIRPRRTVQ
ncbi:hypothetical protein Plhal304r1_c018g0064481 [Plasmopara halstedii]